MTDAEQRLLAALARMSEQYLGNGKADYIDHQCISAGEDAVELLISYGLLERCSRGGAWTKPGKALLRDR